MSESYEHPELRADLIREMRDLAERSATVRDLVRLIHSRLALKDDALIPVLAYFAKAFCLSLPQVLPIREWMGTDKDVEIDAIILPAIENAKERWLELSKVKA